MTASVYLLCANLRWSEPITAAPRPAQLLQRGCAVEAAVNGSKTLQKQNVFADFSISALSTTEWPPPPTGFPDTHSFWLFLYRCVCVCLCMQLYTKCINLSPYTVFLLILFQIHRFLSKSAAAFSVCNFLLLQQPAYLKAAVCTVSEEVKWTGWVTAVQIIDVYVNHGSCQVGPETSRLQTVSLLTVSQFYVSTFHLENVNSPWVWT